MVKDINSGGVSVKAGDLLKWTDYKFDPPVEYIGLLVRDLRGYWTEPQDWHDIVVFTGKGHEKWTSWQCEVIYESR